MFVFYRNPNRWTDRDEICSAFWLKLYNTKVASQPQLSGYRSPFLTPNPDMEGPGPGVLLEPWCLTFKEVFKIKVVVNVPFSEWPQGQGIGPAGPSRPMPGYLNMLELSNKTLQLLTF